jgi:allophanate hydrolase subunit 1
VRGALAGKPGIGQIDIKPGDKDFTVHYDNTKTNPEAIAKALVAAGETGARVKA